MCDQLSTVGVEFNLNRMKDTFEDGLRYCACHPFPYVPPAWLPTWTANLWLPQPKPWAIQSVYSFLGAFAKRDTADCHDKSHHQDIPEGKLWDTARPWGLGQIRYPESKIQLASGKTVRHPGLFKRVNPETNTDTNEPLENTSERIHSCVRIRLACEGLALDDVGPWKCEGLLKDDKNRDLWRLEPGSALSKQDLAEVSNFKPQELVIGKEYAEANTYKTKEGDGQWRWVYARQDEVSAASDTQVPAVKELPEEPLTGFWEKLLLATTTGKKDVWRFAEDNAPFGLQRIQQAGA
jgi:hypothetical protein